MTENQQNEPGLGDELRDLGKNLSDFLRAAWATEERKRFQQDVESSLNDLGATINKAASDFSTSETGQRLKTDIDGIRQKVESSEVSNRARNELLEALKRVNVELTKAVDKWESSTASREPQSGAENPVDGSDA